MCILTGIQVLAEALSKISIVLMPVTTGKPFWVALM